jgi:sulfite reductase (NADPH) hemoprotein beta-component
MATQVLTANRLIDGDVVYWRAGRWVEALGEADIFASEPEGKAAVAEAQHFVAANVVVNPYLFDVRQEADGLYPVKEREIIRAMGPSIHEDMGKRAAGLTPASILKAAAARDASPNRASTKSKDDDVSI